MAATATRKYSSAQQLADACDDVASVKAAFLAGECDAAVYADAIELVTKRGARAHATLAVAFLPAGTDRRGDGMFITTRPKVEVTITRGSGKPRVIRENVEDWLLMLDHADEISAACK